MNVEGAVLVEGLSVCGAKEKSRVEDIMHRINEITRRCERINENIASLAGYTHL